MADIFNYAGQANPPDLKLTDPTVLAGGGGGTTWQAAAAPAADCSTASQAILYKRGFTTPSSSGSTSIAALVYRGVAAAISALATSGQPVTTVYRRVASAISAATAAVLAGVSFRRGASSQSAGASMAADGALTDAGAASPTAIASVSTSARFNNPGSGLAAAAGAATASADVSVPGVLSAAAQVTALSSALAAPTLISSPPAVTGGFGSAYYRRRIPEIPRPPAQVHLASAQVDAVSTAEASANVVRGIESILAAPGVNAKLAAWATRAGTGNLKAGSAAAAQGQVEDVEAVNVLCGIEV
jgi:hypothetical protein